jgi:hypothetical protein
VPRSSLLRFGLRPPALPPDRVGGPCGLQPCCRLPCARSRAGGNPARVRHPLWVPVFAGTSGETGAESDQFGLLSEPRHASAKPAPDPILGWHPIGRRRGGLKRPIGPQPALG